jgi:hypothetical protein
MAKRNQDHVSDGEVVLVDRSKVAAPKPIMEVSHSQAEKMRPKRPLSEKQQENLKKLIERNKAKALEWKAKVPEKLEEIPEDKVAIQVKPKRKYNRTMPHPLSNLPKPVEIEEVKEEVKEVKEVKPRKKYVRKPKTPVSSDQESEEESEVDSRRMYFSETAKKPKRRIVSDTSDFDSDSEVDHKVQKYVAKTQARLTAVKQIEQQIQNRMNPYASRNLSIF